MKGTVAFLLLSLVLSMASAVGAAAGTAMPPTDSEALAAAAERFMQRYRDDLLARLGAPARVDYRLAALDRRLAMAGCATPLTVSARPTAQFGSRLNLQVGCESGNTWSLYVPVELSVYRPVVTATRPLGHDETVQRADVRLMETDVARLTGQYLTTLDEAVGMAVKRPVAQDATLTAEHLQPPLLVKRGETVLLTATGSSISVKMPGIAMTDGRRGEQIRVKNTTSGKIVAARMVEPGHAQVSM